MLLNFEHLRDSDALAPEEGELLYALVRGIKPTVCMETGTHKGLSSHYIAQALAHNGQGHLTTCDPIDWGQAEIFAESSVGEYITFLPKRGIEVTPEQQIDFLFIDGYHGKQDVLEEIDHFFPLLSENAIVVFHDCDNEPVSNTQCVNAAVFERGLKTVYVKTKNRMRIYEHSGF